MQIPKTWPDHAECCCNVFATNPIRRLAHIIRCHQLHYLAYLSQCSLSQVTKTPEYSPEHSPLHLATSTKVHLGPAQQVTRIPGHWVQALTQVLTRPHFATVATPTPLNFAKGKVQHLGLLSHQVQTWALLVHTRPSLVVLPPPRHCSLLLGGRHLKV